MKRAFFLLPLLFMLTSGVSSGQDGGHTLFGDFKVDEKQADKAAPATYYIILYSETGNVLQRQAVSSSGRYRFLNVANGRYFLVVQLGNDEVTRIPVSLNEFRRTDVQRDIYLEWRAAPGPRAADPAAISAADAYNRPRDNQAVFTKAQEAMKKGDNDQAVALLRQVVSADPKDHVAWTELGTVYFKKGDAGEAEKAYQRALEAQPSFFLAMLNLGKTRVARKNFEGAIEVLTEAVKANPQSADANYWLGESYLQIKKGSKAVSYLNEAIRLDPAGKAEAHLRLATLYHGAGLKDRAAAEYEQFLVKKPDYPEKKKLQDYISQNKQP